MGDEFPGGLGADLGWNSPLPAGPFDSVPTGVGAASCHRGLDPHLLPASSLQIQGPGAGAGGEKLQVWLVWVTGRVQSPQGADEGSPPSGAPMRDAGKPSSEQLELWAAVLVDEAALWVRRAWPQDPGPYLASTL